MVRILSLTLLTIVGFANAQNANHPPSASCRADVFVPDSLKDLRRVLSPNGLFQVILDGYREEKDSAVADLRIFQAGALLGNYELRDLSGGIFVKWSPDSSAFYIMWSNGGMAGAYEVRIFRVLPNAVTEIFPAKLAETEFRHKYNCQARGINVFAVRWLNGSEQLQMAMQVYPTSDCGKQMGVTRGYTVRLDDGTIVTRYSQKAMEMEMKQCPSPIWPTGFWSDEDLQQATAKVEAKGSSN
jgi:hypothetical protein